MRELTSCVFNIQKYSIHDGPGIRTAVFMKGCPLRCAWCSNPESQDPRVQVMVAPGAADLGFACPHSDIRHSLSWDDGRSVVQTGACDACLRNLKARAGEAVTIEGRTYSVDEVVRTCLQDLPFYEESGGGVTLSGGEVLMHHRFALELLRRLADEGIHTAIETTGHVAPRIFRHALARLDLLLIDVKHYNSDRHEVWTGVRLDLILGNLAIALDSGVEMLVRIPVIPGFNDSIDDAQGFCDLLRPGGVDRVQLLPFHQFGERKYQLWGRSYAMADVPALHEEDLAAYRGLFLTNGIDAFF